MPRYVKYEPPKPYNPFVPRPIDLTRATFVLIRQSKEKSAELRAESRKKQLALLDVALQLRGDGREDMVWKYDEGDGVSGRKRIDQRPEMERLYNDLAAGLLGSGVVIAEDRLFRDRYLTQVGLFIIKAELARLQLFVPEMHTYYDFSEYKDQEGFVDVMRTSYRFYNDQIKTKMVGAGRDKSLDGRYDGRLISFGYVISKAVKKEEQRYILFEPHARVRRWCWEFLEENGYYCPGLWDEIQKMPYLYRDLTEEEEALYYFKTVMQKVPGGWKPGGYARFRESFLDVALAGHWAEKQAVVKYNNHAALIEPERFDALYYRWATTDYKTGERLKDRPPKVATAGKPLLHGLIKISGFHVSAEGDGYRAYTLEQGEKRTGLVLPPTINQEIEKRLIELAEADPCIGEHLKTYLEETKKAREKETLNLTGMIQDCQAQIDQLNANLQTPKIMAVTSTETAVGWAGAITELQKQRDALTERLDSQGEPLEEKELKEFYDVIEDIPGRWHKKEFPIKFRIMHLLLREVEIEELSPKVLRVTCVWLSLLHGGRPDIGLMMRAEPGSHKWTDEELDILRTCYPTATIAEVLQALPRRTYQSARDMASVLTLRRQVPQERNHGLHLNMTWADNELLPDISIFDGKKPYEIVWILPADIEGYEESLKAISAQEGLGTDLWKALQKLR